MYRVFSDDTCIHDSKSPEKAVHLIDPVLKLGDNIAGSFSFTIPTNNVGYNIVTRLISTIKVYRENKLIWTGRVITETFDFYGHRKCSCEGALAFLNDTIQTSHTYNNTTMENFLQTLISNHNAKVPVSRRINIGSITVHDMNDSHVYSTNYENTWTIFKKEIYDRLGGHVRIRYVDSDDVPRLDYLGDYPKTATQEINFGNNLLDFTKNWDLSNLVTVILPRGAQLDNEDEWGNKLYVTVESVNNGSKYVKNNTGYNTYGWISEVIDFSDVETPSVLLELANLYLSSLQFDEMQLNVSAFDLHHLNSNISSFDLLDEVRCISKPHGMDTMFPVEAMSIPLDKPDSVSYTMGKTSESLSTKTYSANQNILSKIQNMPSAQNLLDAAKQQATEILNMATTGYVNIIQENEQSQALVITNTPGIANATKLWRFNMNGLGYSNNGGTTYDLAITMDGTIVADFIKTGILSDGVGKNYWNLSTGEFSLQWNTQLLDARGLDTGQTLIDIYSLANTANAKIVGGNNYLNGTEDWNGWRKSGGWLFDSNYAACSSKPSVDDWNDVIKSPSNGLLYSKLRGYKVCISFEGYSGDTWGTVSTTNALYLTLSLCDAQGSRKAHIDKMLYLSTAKQRRYALIDLVDSAFTREGYQGSLADLYLEVWFINRSKHYVRIDHVKLERGNTPTDWDTSHADKTADSKATAQALSESAQNNAIAAAKNDATAKANAAKNEAITTAGQKDTNVLALAKTFTNNISEQDRAYTDTQRRALDASLNQAGVLKRLTNNYQSQGIYLSQGQLYINASYIRTGTLDAGIIKAGIICDNQNLNKWNLVTGYFETRNLVAKNANITGNFQAGRGNVSEIKNGTIRFFHADNNSMHNAMTIDGAVKFIDDQGRISGSGYGGRINFDRCLILDGPTLAVSTDDTKPTYTGYTGRVVFRSLKFSNGQSGSVSFDIINGLIVGVYGPSPYFVKHPGENGVLSGGW